MGTGWENLWTSSPSYSPQLPGRYVGLSAAFPSAGKP